MFTSYKLLINLHNKDEVMMVMIVTTMLTRGLMHHKRLHLNIPKMIFLILENKSWRWSEVGAYAPVEYILSFSYFWRGENMAPHNIPNCLFWAEGNWRKADMGKMFCSLLIYLNIEYKFPLWRCLPSPLIFPYQEEDKNTWDKMALRKSLHKQDFLT